MSTKIFVGLHMRSQRMAVSKWLYSCHPEKVGVKGLISIDQAGSVKEEKAWIEEMLKKGRNGDHLLAISIGAV